MVLPSSCALIVTIAAPAHTTTNTPVNTIADWCAGAVMLSMLSSTAQREHTSSIH